MANISDVARDAKVSTQTVSRVINNSPHVMPATRNRVEAAIAGLGYRPSLVARALVSRRTRTIGVVTGNSLYGPSSTAQGFNKAARTAGYGVIMASPSPGSVREVIAAIDSMLDAQMDALVVIAADLASIEAIEQLHLPVPIAIAESIPGATLLVSSIDQVAGAASATTHLVELGHREIAMLGGPARSIEARQRETGWRFAVQQAQLRPNLLVTGDWSPESGYAAAVEFSTGNRRATGVFAANDHMAFGLIHGFSELGISVPGDMSVVGFDDIPEAARLLPPLTTVRQDFHELGVNLMVTLHGALNGETASHDGSVAPTIIVRSSTAPPIVARTRHCREARGCECFSRGLSPPL